VRRSILGWLGGVLGSVLFPALAWGLVVNDYSPTRDNRFNSGYPGSPIANTDSSFIGAGYDWSGVGWLDSIQSFALLGPRCVLIANHYPAGVGDSITFLSTDGQLKTYTVGQTLGTHAVPPYASDLAVAVLTAPIPASDNVHAYPVLFKGYSPSLYVGSNLLMYGQTAQIGWNSIWHAGQLLLNDSPPYGPDSAAYFDYGYDANTPDRAIVQGGDSGSPSFIVTGVSGEMYLAGGHYLLYNGNAGGVDTFVPLSLSTVSGYMAQVGYLPYVVTPATAQWAGSALYNQLNDSRSWAAVGGALRYQDAMNTDGTVNISASLRFNGAQTAQYTVNVSALQKVTGITFVSAGGKPFTFNGGGTLTIGEAGITNNDSAVQTFNCPIALRASQRWSTGSGGLAVSSTIDTAGYLLLVEGPGPVTLSGAISGTGGLAKDGSGTLTLSSPGGNSYTGQTFIHGGTLAIAQDNHLGTPPASLVPNQLTIDGGTLQATASFNLPANRGITLGSPGGTIAVDNGQTLTVDSVIAGSSAPLVKAGAGTVNLTATNTYSGATTVNYGTLVVSGTAGSIAQAYVYWGAPIYVNRCTLTLDNSGGDNTNTGNRLADYAYLNLRDGVFQVIASSSGTRETFGFVRALSGENTYNLTLGASGAVLTHGVLSRSAGATINFTSTGGALDATNRIVFNALPAGFVDQGTFVNGADYTVYDVAGGVHLRAMDYTTDASAADVNLTADAATLGGVTNKHVQLRGGTFAITAQTSDTINTLKIAGANNLTLDGAATLTLANGGLLKTGGGSSTISGGNALTTPGEYVIRTDSATDQLVINTVIAGGAGLTKSGQGTLILGSSGNSFAGPTTVAGGTLRLGAPGAVPAGSNLVVTGTAAFDLAGCDATVANITIGDGLIQNTGAAAALSLGGQAGNVAYVGIAGGGTIAVGTLNLATPGAAAASHTFTVAAGQPASADLTITSIIADGSLDPQSLVKDGPGILKLSAASSYTGRTSVLAGTLALGNSNVMPGTSHVVIQGGTLAIAAYSNTVGTVSLQGGTISGTTGVLTGSSYQLSGGTISAILGGAAALTKSTSDTVILSGANTYTAGTNINGGILSVGSDGNLGFAAGGLTFNGGTLQITGTGFNQTPRAITWYAGGGGFDIADASNTFTLTQGLAGPGPLSKAGVGTLVLGGTVGSAGIAIQDGTLRLGGVGRLTGSPMVSIGGIATLDLNNFDNTIGGLSLSGGTVTSGTGTLTLAGRVTYSRSIWPATISGKVNLGAATRTFDVTAGSSTDLTVAAAISGSGVGLTKAGSGMLTLTNANAYTGTTTIANGTLTLDGNTGGLAAASAVTFTGSGTFNYDNTGAAGTINDSFGALTFSAGEDTVQSTRTANYNTTVTFNSLANRAAGAVGSFLATGSGAAANLNQVKFVSGPILTNQFLNQGLFYGGADYAVYASPGSYLRAMNYTSDLNVADVSTGSTIPAGDAGRHVQVDVPISGQPSISLASLKISGNTDFGLGTNAILTLTSGGLLKAGNSAATISGGLKIDNSGVELVVRIDQPDDTLPNDTLTISTPIAGAGLLTKAGAGTLVLGAANNYAGMTFVDAGTLKLANALALGNSGAVTTVNNRGVLDLNGQAIANVPVVLNGFGVNYGGALLNSSSADSSLSGPLTLGSAAGIGGTGNITLSGQTNYGTFTLIATGANTLNLAGSQVWGNGASVAIQSGTVRYSLDGSDSVSVGTGNTIAVSGGATLELAGSKSALSDGTRSVNITNNSDSLGVNVTGTNQVVGGIDGTGATVVQAGASLTAGYILQNTLTINGSTSGGGKVTIASVGGGSAGAAAWNVDSNSALVNNVSCEFASGLTDGTDVSYLGPTLAANAPQPAGSGGDLGSASLLPTGISLVPEPTSLLLLLAMGAPWLAWRVRRRARRA